MSVSETAGQACGFSADIRTSRRSIANTVESATSVEAEMLVSMFRVVLTMVGIVTSDVLGWNPPHNRHGPEVKEIPAKNSGDPKSRQRTDMEKSVNFPRPDNAMRGLRGGLLDLRRH